MQGEHLYRRVLHATLVDAQQPLVDGADVLLHTRELASASEVVPHVRYSIMEAHCDKHFWVLH